MMDCIVVECRQLGGREHVWVRNGGARKKWEVLWIERSLLIVLKTWIRLWGPTILRWFKQDKNVVKCGWDYLEVIDNWDGNVKMKRILRDGVLTDLRLFCQQLSTIVNNCQQFDRQCELTNFPQLTDPIVGEPWWSRPDPAQWNVIHARPGARGDVPRSVPLGPARSSCSHVLVFSCSRVLVSIYPRVQWRAGIVQYNIILSISLSLCLSVSLYLCISVSLYLCLSVSETSNHATFSESTAFLYPWKFQEKSSPCSIPRTPAQ
jgi:hypothetical protein